MDIKALKYFLVIAQEQSINKASNIVYISQPALTRQIQKLEEELDTQLFFRTKDGLKLTSQGIKLQLWAKEIVSLANRAKNEIKNNKLDIEGRIAIGCGEQQAFDKLAQHITDYQKLHTKVNFEIFTGNADLIKYKLERGSLDLALVINPIDTDLYDKIDLQEQEDFVVLMRNDDPLSKFDTISLDMLSDSNVIFPRRLQLFHHLTEKASIQNINISTSSLSSNASILVQKGFGYAITINSFKQRPLPQGVIYKPLSFASCTTSSIIFKKQIHVSNVLDDFINYLRLCYKK